MGVSASKWFTKELENGDVEFFQEFIDIREIADSEAFQDEQIDQNFLEKIVPTVKCEVFDPSHRDKLDKAICVPQNSEMILYGDYNLADGSATGLYLYPKCFSPESGVCSLKEQKRFLELMSEGDGVYLELFVQEIYLDYEDFAHPLKKRQKRVFSRLVSYSVEEQTFKGWDKYIY